MTVARTEGKRESGPKYVFQGLAWPAAGGNVAWAFFTVFIAERPFPATEMFARAMLLFLLAGYLVGNWVRTRDEDGHLWYWIGDAFHLATICVASIATALRPDLTLPYYSLMALFTFTALGHFG